MDTRNLLKGAEFIRGNKDHLISLWERRARLEMKSANQATKELLRDDLVALLEHLGKTLLKVSDGVSPRTACENVFQSESSSIHGIERAQETDYGVDEVLEDYVLLRQVLTDEIEAQGLADLRTVEAINRIFELASLNAVKSFSDSVRKSQEKMLVTLVHDVRSPLSVAASSLGLIASEPDAFSTFFPMAERSINRSMEMISSLLNQFSQESKYGLTMSFEKVDLAKVFASSQEELSQVYGDRLKFDLPEVPVEGIFSPDILVRVLENLVSNAFKHGGSDLPVSVRLEDKGDEVTLIVHNHGKPIPQQKQEEIFEIFSSESPQIGDRKTGWGIGLTHVRMVASAHAGEVELVSSENEGTCFILKMNKHSQEPGQKHFSYRESEKTKPSQVSRTEEVRP